MFREANESEMKKAHSESEPVGDCVNPKQTAILMFFHDAGAESIFQAHRTLDKRKSCAGFPEMF